ncbi:MAG TPA: D-arabinono-1,4-lactone oxidase [Myxococcota bacterium]|nr:D-arabinono-1,4-lactone oxidase [Myxococcota bacterium]
MAEKSWANFSGRVTCEPAHFARPRSEAEIAGAVRAAAASGRGLRVTGTGHSFTPLCATHGTLVSLDDWQGVEIGELDREARRAKVRSGTKLHALGEPLLAAGLALPNMGDVDVQSLAGAVSTGTHGTGPSLSNVSAQVIGARLVLASGELLELDLGSDPRRLDAARVSLGLLGVLTELTLQLVPAYRLHERIWKTGIHECLAELERDVAATRHYEFWWYPHKDYAERKSLALSEGEPASVAGRKGERIDWSSRIFATPRELRFNELEYSVPAAAGPECFRAVRERMKSRWPDVIWPVEYRTLGSDPAWLSTAHQRDSVAISLHQDARLPCDAFFADCEPIFVEAGGRPHWAKLHNLGAPQLAKLYPRWEDFRALRRELDPRGVFANEYLRELFEIA